MIRAPLDEIAEEGRVVLARLYLELAHRRQLQRVMSGRRRPVPVPPVGPVLDELRAMIARGTELPR